MLNFLSINPEVRKRKANKRSKRTRTQAKKCVVSMLAERTQAESLLQGRLEARLGPPVVPDSLVNRTLAWLVTQAGGVAALLWAVLDAALNFASLRKQVAIETVSLAETNRARALGRPLGRVRRACFWCIFSCCFWVLLFVGYRALDFIGFL